MRSPAQRPRLRSLLLVAAGLIAIDAATKSWLAPWVNLRDIDWGVVRFQEMYNSGASFSMGQSLTPLFALLAVAVAVFIIRKAKQPMCRAWMIVFALLLAGTLGNLADRLFRAPGFLHGEVVDWIAFPHLFIFNLSDAYLTFGVIIAIVLAWRGIRLDGSVEEKPVDPTPEPK